MIIQIYAVVDVNIFLHQNCFLFEKKLLNLTATSFSSPRFMPPILSLFASLFYTTQPLHSIFSDFVEINNIYFRKSFLKETSWGMRIQS